MKKEHIHDTLSVKRKERKKKSFLFYLSSFLFSMSHSINILLPTYNPKSEHLMDAMHSILNQTEEHWQLFIQDDHHPSSQSEEIVQPFLKDPRIHFQKNTERFGIGKNWNTCLIHAMHNNAPYVAFLFQDDVWEKDYLEKGMQILDSDTSIGMVAMKHAYRYEEKMQNNDVYASIERWKSDRKIAGKQNGKDLLIQWIESDLKPNIIGEPSFVILRKNILQKVGAFREDLPQCLDSEMWMRILEESDCFFLEDKEYGFFRVHRDAASAQNEESGAGRIDRLLCIESLLQRKKIDPSFLRKKYSEILINLFDQYTKRVQNGKKKEVQQKWKVWMMLMRHPIITVATLQKMIRLSIARRRKKS